MTGRTHDLAAFTALTYVVAVNPLPNQLSLATALAAFSANMVGGLAPDLDQPTANLYRKVRGGSILAKLISPFLGGHRFISHSILGILVFGFLTRFVLDKMSAVVLVDMQIVWQTFMIGFVSHLIMDTFTKEGVAWFFPIPWRVGIPPFSTLRLKTGGLLEKSFVFPGLLAANVYLIYNNYAKFLALFHLVR